MQIFSDLTNTFINQTDQSTVSISAHFYNESEPLILDDTYITRGKLKHNHSTKTSIIKISNIKLFTAHQILSDSDGRLRMKRYDKGDDFNFPIVNFPFICGNIPAAPTYEVYIPQLI